MRFRERRCASVSFAIVSGKFGTAQKYLENEWLGFERHHMQRRRTALSTEGASRNSAEQNLSFVPATAHGHGLQDKHG